ncbi:MAG: MBL fold metallo-hydrolase [Nitrospinota bacterium]|nr:MBL fold metallo-hydrolase [Nitrospinota bacterium]
MSEKKEITTNQLLTKMREAGGAPLFIVDVRNEDDYDAWKIEDVKTPATINLPYIDFIEEPEQMTEKVPNDKQVVVLCGKGGASDYVADILRKSGRDAVNVAGGMKSWGNLYHSETVYENGDTRVIQVNRVGKGCLSYILISGKEAAVVDPARHIDQYLDFLKENNLTLKLVFDTHIHADHLSGGVRLAEATGAEYLLNKEDAPGAVMKFRSLEDGMEFNIGSTRLKIVALGAPGHTPGSTIIVFDDKLLFSGDTLFVSSMGRPDLGGQAAKWVKDLYQTIQGLQKFGDDFLILPTHTSGPEEWDDKGIVMATLGRIRAGNPLMNISDEKDFSARVLAHLPEQPDTYDKMRKANIGATAPTEEEMEQWELGKNRCAIEAAEEAKGKQ